MATHDLRHSGVRSARYRVRPGPERLRRQAPWAVGLLLAGSAGLVAVGLLVDGMTRLSVPAFPLAVMALMLLATTARSAGDLD